MKTVLILTAAFALLSTPVFAQAAATPTAPAAPAVAATPLPTCGPIPAAPALVDVATLKGPKEVTAATEALNGYLLNAQANLTCRRTFIEGERAAMQAKQEMLKAQTDSYNEDVRVITGVRDAWDAQVTAFNEKQKKPPRR